MNSPNLTSVISDGSSTRIAASPGQTETEIQTTELPPDVEVVTQTKVIPTEQGDILVTTKTTKKRKVKVIKSVTRRVYETPTNHPPRPISESSTGLQLHNFPQRRGSFLYRPSRQNKSAKLESADDQKNSSKANLTENKSNKNITNRNSNISSNSSSNNKNNAESSSSIINDECETADDVIITPFAQILASLRKVRANFMHILNTDPDHETEEQSKQTKKVAQDKHVPVLDTEQKIANDTLKELEWCLDRLENIQTYRSVSDMASIKFKQIINRELNQESDSSKSGHQVSDYICKTFLDPPLDESMGEGSSCEDPINENEELSGNKKSSGSSAATRSAAAEGETATELHTTTDTAASARDSSDYSSSSRMVKVHSAPSSFKRVSKGDRTESMKKDKIVEDATGEEEEEKESIESMETKEKSDDEAENKRKEKGQLSAMGVALAQEDKVIEVLDKELMKWGMDLFEFSRLTDNNTLVVISYTVFKRHNLISKFQIDEAKLTQFLVMVEKTYRATVPYHNSIHAADVTQSANVLLGCPAFEKVFSDLEVLSVIMACIIHDIDHPGVTNQYLINSGNILATLYNDSSVLENHHLATAFSLLAKPDCDVLSTLSKRQRQSLRRMVIDMVLATDMSKHMTLLADLKTMVETKKVAGSGILTLDTYQDRIQILENLVHCSDLSNPTKPLALYQQWTDRIMQEFFLQGDKEREQELDISPMCDRNTATVEKYQVSFIDFIVHPLWETWTELVYPDTQGILETLEENRQWYFVRSQPPDNTERS